MKPTTLLLFAVVAVLAYQVEGQDYELTSSRQERSIEKRSAEPEPLFGLLKKIKLIALKAKKAKKLSKVIGGRRRGGGGYNRRYNGHGHHHGGYRSRYGGRRNNFGRNNRRSHGFNRSFNRRNNNFNRRDRFPETSTFSSLDNDFNDRPSSGGFKLDLSSKPRNVNIKVPDFSNIRKSLPKISFV